ncbi:MAG: hypothetical protein AAF725_01665 [Acidobacteriota bacterium]
MEVLLLTLSVFLIAVLIMSVGVIFKRPCLRGSCGGPEVVGSSGESLSCSTCPNRKKGQRRDGGLGGGLPVIE